MSKNKSRNFQSKPAIVGQGAQGTSMAIENNDTKQDPNQAGGAPEAAAEESAGTPVLNSGEGAAASGDDAGAEPQQGGDSGDVKEPQPEDTATFQNGAGETATIASLSNASVSQIPPPPTQPEVKTPVVEDKGTQDKSVLPPPTVAAAPAPVAKAPVAAVAKTDVTGEPSDFDKYMAKIESTGTPAQKALVASLNQYLLNMKKGRPLTPPIGAGHNQQLWSTLFQVVEKAIGEEFRVQWNIVLAFFERYKDDAFGPRYVFRFAEAWARDPDQLAAMQRLINLIHLTSNRGEREGNLKRVDMGRTLAQPFSEEGRARVLGFYGK